MGRNRFLLVMTLAAGAMLTLAQPQGDGDVRHDRLPEQMLPLEAELLKRANVSVGTWSIDDWRFIPGYPTSPGTGTGLTASFDVHIGVDASQLTRAFLVYKMNGLSHWTAAPRAVNGKGLQGGLEIRARSTAGFEIEEINPHWLRPGRNEITFTPAVSGLGSILPPNVITNLRHIPQDVAPALPYTVSDLYLVVLPGDGPAGPRLTLSHPLNGVGSDNSAYLRGFVEPPLAEVFVDGVHVADGIDPEDGSFDLFVPRASGPFRGQKAGRPWTVELSVVFLDGTLIERAIQLGGEEPRDGEANGDEEGGDSAEDGAPRQGTAKRLAPGERGRLEYEGARLDVPADALSQKTQLTMRPLSRDEMPALDSGMDNVTSPFAALRLGPDGSKFKKPLTLTLPYDPEHVPPGLGPDDIRTWYFDVDAGRWIALERVAVDRKKHTVTSLTDHFTDFVNATLTLPDHPSGANFQPNSIQELEEADPSAGITLIAPPTASSGGDAELAFPLVVPPGRRGLEPSLTVAYSSAAGNSWLGVGWDLRLPSVEVDTTFGVPLYDPDRESETYLLAGGFLAPVADRLTPADRITDRVFTMRVEGSFQRVIRRGDRPDNYWWEVTQQDGTRFIYGRGEQARLRDYEAPHNIFRWYLEQVIDVHGNTVDYTYAEDSPATSGERSTEIYLREIAYSGSHGVGGFYKVRFHLDDGARPDKLSTGMPGFKVLTRFRLDHVEVWAGEEMVRRYDFLYREGDFRKTLLDGIAVADADGSEFYRHTFDYFRMPTLGDGYDGFEAESAWDGSGAAADFTDSLNVSGGGHAFVGLGDPACFNHGGVQIGGSVGDTTTLRAFLDVNGDGLPDRIDDRGNVDFNRFDLAADAGSFSPGNFPNTSTLAHNLEWSFDVGIGAHILADTVTAGVSWVWSHSNDDRLLTDANGDGWIDLVSTQGSFNVQLGDGTSFSDGADWDGFRLDDLDLEIPGQREEVLNTFKLSNTLRKLALPYDGEITITGTVQKKQTGGDDGVEVSIYRGSQRIWAHTFAPGDTSACEPAPADACGGGLILDVTAGERLYFMSSSVEETSADAVLWSPTVTYSGHATEGLEPYGARIFRFAAAADFRLAGRFDAGWTAPANGTVRVFGALDKQTTADDVVATVRKNGEAPLYTRHLAASEEGTFDEVPAIDVEVGDVLTFKLASDNQVDPARVRWTPTVTYEGGIYCRDPEGQGEVCGAVACSGDAGDVVCTMSGDPSPQVPILPESVILPAQVDTDVHVLQPSAEPTRFWTAPEAGTFDLDVEWTGPFPVHGPVLLYVQGVHRLVAKHRVGGPNPIRDPNAPAIFQDDFESGDRTAWEGNTPRENLLPPFVTQASFSVTVTLEEGERLYFTALADDPRDVGDLEVDIEGSDDSPPVNERYRDPGGDPLAGGYHRWFYGEWNGNISFRETGLDPALGDEESDFVAAIPRWQGIEGLAAPVWTAAGFDLYLAAEGEKPSRQGNNAAARLDQAAGGSGGGPDILRKVYGRTFALDASVGPLGASVSQGFGATQIDLLDMNGDRYPDQVGKGAIRFSTGQGFEAVARNAPDLGDVRRSEDANLSTSFGLGIPYTKKSGDGKPKEVVTTMPSVGSTTSVSQERIDLLDVNGDGLPDRVTMNPGGSAMSVRLNLGYSTARQAHRFGRAEAWSVPAWDDRELCGEVLDIKDLEVLGAPLADLVGPNSLGLTTSASLNAGLAIGPVGGGAATTLSRTVVDFADINGDGLVDHVLKDHDSEAFRVKLNHGDHWGPEQPWHAPAWMASLGDGYNPGGLFNCLDAVTFTGTVGGNGSVGGGKCFPLIPPTPVVGLQVEISVQASGSKSGLQLFFEDVDGDGLADHILKKSGDPNVYVKRNKARKVNLLRQVVRPLGGSFTLDYRRQGNRVDHSDEAHRIDMPNNQWVLAEVTLDDGFDEDGDGRGNTYTTSFEYFNDAFFDRVTRQFYGYARVEATLPDGSKIDRHYHNQSFYLRNLLTKEIVKDAAGRLFTMTTTQYQLREVGAPGSGSFFPAPVAEAVFFYEGTTSDENAAPKSTRRIFEFDGFGNVTHFEDFADPGPEDDMVADITYYVDPTLYVVQPAEIVVRDRDGRMLRQRRGAYDAQGELIRLEQVLVGGRDPETGSPYTGSENAVTTLAWDEVGNLASITDPTGFTQTFSYDPVTRTHVTGIRDSFGYTNAFDYDLRYGLVTDTTDKNDNVIRRVYDGFGRLVEVFAPADVGAAVPTVAMEYAPDARVPFAVTRHKDVTRPGDPIETVVFVNGLLQGIQTKRDIEIDLGTLNSTRVGMQVSGRVVFDVRGRVAAAGHPVFDTGSATSFVDVALENETRFEYDILSRRRRALFPDGADTQVDFAFGTLDGVPRFLTSRTDAEGRVTKTFLDVTGSVCGIEQSNTIGGTTETLVTRYDYNPLSELTSVQDAAGNLTELEVDTLGRRTVIDNPDAGRVEHRYDPAGNLGARITANLAARGQEIRYHYTFHRLERIAYPEMADRVFTYGEPGAPLNRADRLVAVSDESGIEERFYGRLGELVMETKTATALNGFTPKGPYTTTLEYDSFNRLLAVTYPDGEELAYTFDAGGQVQSVVGMLGATRYVYATHLGYDEFGQKARIVYGNGVESRFTYDPRTRRLVRLQSAGRGGREFQDLRFSYNRVGSILELGNDVAVPRPSKFGGPAVQTFRYDDLYQLIGASGEHRFAPNKRSVYSFSASYGETGSILSKSQLHQIVQPSGQMIDQMKTSYDWSYEYEGPQPHAATHFGERTFHYDLNGNQTGWEHDQNGTRRTTTWDEENRVKAIADNGQTTRFLYDAEGQRTNKAGQHGETIYVNPLFSVRNGSIGSKHFFVDGTRIAAKLAQPALESSSPPGKPVEDKLYFYHGDHSGSSHFVTDHEGDLYQHLEYFPFGDLWVDERSESERTPYLFSAKELDDETGLYYFGFRYLEPRQGQWIRPDPIYDRMFDTERLTEADLLPTPFRLPGHMYAYVSNDPVNLIDPTGLTGGPSSTCSQGKKVVKKRRLSRGASSDRSNQAQIRQVISAHGRFNEGMLPLAGARSRSGRATGKRSSNLFKVPQDITLRFFGPDGSKLRNEVANVIERGGDLSASDVEIIPPNSSRQPIPEPFPVVKGPGAEVVNLTLTRLEPELINRSGQKSGKVSILEVQKPILLNKFLEGRQGTFDCVFCLAGTDSDKGKVVLKETQSKKRKR